MSDRGPVKCWCVSGGAVVGLIGQRVVRYMKFVPVYASHLRLLVFVITIIAFFP